ncbi:MAG TPA: response regulator [Candidatus Binatia bacterium]|nr:response regulator [Candidatus Binatia bacterium]
MAIHGVILLIVDGREFAEMFARMFEAFGGRYTLRTVESADMARAYFRGAGKYSDRKQYPMPNLVILDLKIRNTDGFEVLRWIHEEVPDLPVVVLIEPTAAFQAGRAFQIGANALLTKPPTFGELRDVLFAFDSQYEADTAEIAEGPLVIVKSELMALRQVFKQACSTAGIKPLETIESARAYLESQQDKCEPLFVDLDLGESAFELMAWVKKDPWLAETQIIALCRPGDIERLSRAADSGANLFIVKPVTAEKLSQVGARVADSWKRAKLGSAQMSAESEERAAETEAVTLARPGVLYVAEDASDCHLFLTAMSQASAIFAAEFFRTFADVVAYLREKGESRRVTSASPRCLLLDNRAVGEGSREVLRWIRKQSSFPELVVVMLSETDDQETVKAIYRAGADYYLVKPKNFGGLLSIVNVIDAGLRQTPSVLQELKHLPEYRDQFGNPAATGTVGDQFAQL